MGEIIKEFVKQQAKHIEEFACAYYKKTGISPDKATLVQKIHDNKITWHFEPRNEDFSSKVEVVK